MCKMSGKRVNERERRDVSSVATHAYNVETNEKETKYYKWLICYKRNREICWLLNSQS